MDRYRTVISAILCALSYQYFPFGLLISFIPLMQNKIKYSTFYIWGIIYMGGLHLFLLTLANDSHIIAAIFIWLIASLYFGLFYGLGGWVLKIIHEKTTIQWPLLLPILWPAIEYAKSMGSFGNTNGNLGFGLSKIIHYLPITSIIGHIGLGLLIVIINALIWQQAKNKINKTPSIVMIGLIILATMIGSTPTQTQSTQRISVIQTNVEQPIKMNQTHWASVEKHYLKLITSATGNIIILPESILPTNMQVRPWFDKIQQYSTKEKKHILFGTFIKDTGTFNGSLLIQPNGEPITYKKQRLMPFGETLPFRNILSNIIPKSLLFSDFEKGDQTIDIPIEGFSIRPLICLEGIYGKFYASPPNGIMAILANNAWYDNSTAGSKFLKFAQVHAAEFQTMVAVSANTGQSAIISPSGALIQNTTHRNEAILTHPIQIRSTPTMYQQWPWAGSMILIICWIGIIRRQP